MNILDLAVNKIVDLEGIEHLTDLEDLWINWNHIAKTDENLDYLTQLKLKTIYLADNPIADRDDYEQMMRT